MAIFNSYVKLPEGKVFNSTLEPLRCCPPFVDDFILPILHPQSYFGNKKYGCRLTFVENANFLCHETSPLLVGLVAGDIPTDLLGIMKQPLMNGICTH